MFLLPIMKPLIVIFRNPRCYEQFLLIFSDSLCQKTFIHSDRWVYCIHLLWDLIRLCSFVIDANSRGPVWTPSVRMKGSSASAYLETW